MPENKFDTQLQIWLNEPRPTGWQKIWRGFLALWHARWVGGRRIWFAGRMLGEATLAVMPPILMHWAYESISLFQAVIGAGAILVVRLWIGLSGRMALLPSTAGASGEMELVVRFTEMMHLVEHRSADQDDTTDGIRAALGVIEIIARHVTKSEKREISVSLATYNGNHSEEMKIRLRNPGNERPVGKFATRFVVGHYVCRHGRAPRVVHDLRDFGPKGFSSPTRGAMNYRSIIFIPLVRTVDDRTEPCGFISVDSARPYAFYGGRDDAIVVACEPFTSHIQALIVGKAR